MRTLPPPLLGFRPAPTALFLVVVPALADDVTRVALEVDSAQSGLAGRTE